MSVRNRLYIALVKDLLGPRRGSTETMPLGNDPRNEYITGILEPKDYNRSTRNGGLDDYTKADITAYEPEEEHEEDRTERSDDYEINPLTPLDPRAFPKSIGVSFVVKTAAKPVIHFCAIWARYIKDNNVWKRTPDRAVVKNCDASVDNRWTPAQGVRIVLLSRKLADNRWHISIYLINETKVEETFLTTDQLIFQPEIRVKVAEGSLESIDDRKIEGPEERRLELLYREFPALARGHMVGATWKEIDPARPVDPAKAKTSELLSEDVKLLEPQDRELFELPDIRTEYLPACPVSQSIVDAKELGLAESDVRTDVLANKWNPDELGSSVEKLTKSYRDWIQKQDDIVAKLPANHRAIAAENIHMCREAAERMEDGIRILKTDEDARFAFCFMNQVMDTQAFWARKAHLQWRPFQLAFILQCIRGIVDEMHVDRQICDLLWFPTGGGKTEAYLGLMIFTLALRRRKNRRRGLAGIGGAGTAVISRYTLRLLTIQQFRRALNAITACDFWRIKDWRPKGYSTTEKNIWGTARFSIGLWVGGDVTPNITVDHVGFDKVRKMNTRRVGAVGILCHTHEERPPGWNVDHQGEPAQVIKCPRCASLLAVPAAGYSADSYELHWTFQAQEKPTLRPSDLDFAAFRVSEAKITALPNRGFYVLSVKFTTTSPDIKDDTVTQWWRQKVSQIIGTKRTACAYASRPGYFIRRLDDKNRSPCDFEIRCTNPECELSKIEWYEEVPEAAGKKGYLKVTEPFRIPSKPGVSYGMPIPAYTVDAQIYARCPSVIIATADKFARLPFEARAASIFGNVNRFDGDWGYYRDQILPDSGRDVKLGKPVVVEPFLAPELIIQDELHLIEGPLGSLAGLYECAVDALASRYLSGKSISAKYVALTATVRQAASQVISLYSREIRQFPPSATTARDNFFSRVTDVHPLQSKDPGRLYVGVCAPGKGPQTPTVRIWSRLMQEAEDIRRASGGQVQGELDYYWTLVGYFNAIRELASAASLYRQDIPEWLKVISQPGIARQLDMTTYQELSSNVDSMKLPAILEQLEKTGDNIDALLATSMFGTGVDINRLSLMVVHGQPKTTASYIQATGRVGRQMGALVVTFLRSTRPRDLAHYEFFTGYHRSLQRYVEPVTVAPFSPRACDRALGPVAVAMLRNAVAIGNVPVNPEWAVEEYARQKNAASGSRRMGTNRNARELDAIVEFLENRGTGQPPGRRRPSGWVRKTLRTGFEVWENIIRRETSPLFYYEQTYSYEPEHPVVLGDAAHARHNKSQVYQDVPQSLREIEQTTRFE